MTDAEMKRALEVAAGFGYMAGQIRRRTDFAGEDVRGDMVAVLLELSDAITKRGASGETLAFAIRHHRFGCNPPRIDTYEIPDEKTPVERPSRTNLRPPEET